MMKWFLIVTLLTPAITGGRDCVNNDSTTCKTLVSCSSRFHWTLNRCVLPDGKDGVCCPTGTTATGVPRPAFQLTRPTPVITKTIARPILWKAAEDGQRRVDKLIQLEQDLITKGLTIDKRKGRRRPAKFDPNARLNTLKGLQIVEASKELQERLNLNAEDVGRILPQLSLEGTTLQDACLQPIDCTPSLDSKYRNIDGSCNNLVEPSWGSKSSAFQRLLPPDYSNGVDSPRKATDGSDLTDAHEINNQLISIYGHNDNTNITLAVMSWGQFITHDMALAADYVMENGLSPQCCDSNQQMLPPDQLHPQCLPIDVTSDRGYIMFNQTCLNFVRSQIGPDYSCTFNHAQQINSNTHWLDGSQVYGSDASTASNLRAGRDGLLKTSESDGRQLLPIEEGCSDHPFAVCFTAGDHRAEENPQLTIVHTLLMREHNRIATALRELNPDWSDEVLYQETRRIVIAEIQHITYNEYLPILIGTDMVNNYDLLPPSSGYYEGYDETLNPSISNEFTAAAFRITHSSIQGYLELFNSADEMDEDQSFSLSNYFFDGSRLLSPGFIDSALRGLTKQPPQRIDMFYSGEVTINLYRERKPIGSDLVGITVLRGREHGVAGYNQYRQLCGLPKLETFDDFVSDSLDPEMPGRLGQVYKSVDDIDLYIGCLAEVPIGDARVGPTAACLIADQFQKIKKADRYFYDVGGQPGSFTLQQLDQIRQSSLARLICDNSDGTVTHMQPLALRSPQGTNERVPCESIPSIDLTAWKV